jgi:hypothetical protein
MTLTIVRPHRQSATLWVCVDCYFAHHGVLEDHGAPFDREPLGEIPADVETSAGLLLSEHECVELECPGHESLNGAHMGESVYCDGTCQEPLPADECGCDEITFTHSGCEGCGSQLGGTRHALTMWWSA